MCVNSKLLCKSDGTLAPCNIENHFILCAEKLLLEMLSRGMSRDQRGNSSLCLYVIDNSSLLLKFKMGNGTHGGVGGWALASFGKSSSGGLTIVFSTLMANIGNGL